MNNDPADDSRPAQMKTLQVRERSVAIQSAVSHGENSRGNEVRSTVRVPLEDEHETPPLFRQVHNKTTIRHPTKYTNLI